LELGTWNLELGTWNLELGTWNLELGTNKNPDASASGFF
jgi:1-acyl-sn-glycerol-3-phosphate acyltransferase